MIVNQASDIISPPIIYKLEGVISKISVFLKLEGLETIFLRQSCIFDRCHRWTKRISKQSFLGRTLKVRMD